MKNVILVDTQLYLCEALIERSYHIVVLIVSTDAIAEEYRQKYKGNPCITHILSKQELEYVDGIEWLDYDLLETYRGAQREVEFIAHRHLDDGMLATNKYINALAWWNHIFETYRIDFVLSGSLKHGGNYDVPPLYIATHRRIPAFVVPSTISVNAASLRLYNTQTHIPIRSPLMTKEEIKKSLFCSHNEEANPFMQDTPPLNFIKAIRRFIAKYVYKIGGYLGVTFIACMKRGSFSLQQDMGNYPTSFWIQFKNFYYLKKQKKYYNTISQNPTYTEKFVFYAIHFEPEGKTSVCVPLQNQLTVIQMLSKALPEGYKLYVKEHPAQFQLNTGMKHYYLYNNRWFKSIEFYKEIQKLDNVVFVDLDVPSKEIITHARAVATINGTVHYEATFLNKVCIVFGGYDILLRDAQNIIYVDSFKTLKEGLNDVENNPQRFDNSSYIEKYEQYLCNYCVPTKQLRLDGEIILDAIEDYFASQHTPPL